MKPGDLARRSRAEQGLPHRIEHSEALEAIASVLVQARRLTTQVTPPRRRLAAPEGRQIATITQSHSTRPDTKGTERREVAS